MAGAAARHGPPVWALLMPVIIIGGMKSGVFTPTEAAVVAAFYALVVALFIHREMQLAELYGVLVRAAKTTAIVMFLCAGAQVASYMITLADLPGVLGGWLGPLVDNPRLLMAVMMIVLVLIGTALDLTPTILIFAPVMLPIAVKAGIDPVYFGLMFVLNGAIGLITPPVGTVLNVVAGVGRLSMAQVIKGVNPFLLTYTLVIWPCSSSSRRSSSRPWPGCAEPGSLSPFTSPKRPAQRSNAARPMASMQARSTVHSWHGRRKTPCFHSQGDCLLPLIAVSTASPRSFVAFAQDIKPRLIRFGYGLNEQSNQGRAVKVFAEQVEKASRRQDEGARHRRRRVGPGHADAAGPDRRRAGDDGGLHRHAGGHHQGNGDCGTRPSCSTTPRKPTPCWTARLARR